MDGGIFELIVFAGAAFVAALVAGVSGFAFAPIAASVWLHLFTPLETATLTVTHNVLVQGYGTWRVRQGFDWSRLWPFLVGGLPGVTIGIWVLRRADPVTMRIGVAIFLIAFALFGLFRPALKPIRVGPAADAVAAFVGGMLGSMAGFPGILVVIWCSLRGWTRDEQRAVFQPISVALLAMSTIALIANGAMTWWIGERLLIGLPALLLGTWAGFALYGRVNEDVFRKIVQTALLASGVFLLMTF
jgi:uncharacterized membrane protein YfcA